MKSALIDRVCSAFDGFYGRLPTVLVQAPGRVNLIGEHTDYNDGFVLPCAINFHTLVGACPRSDRRVRVLAVDYGNALDEFGLDDPIVQRADSPWANYVRGMVKKLREQGFGLSGVDIAIAGNVPIGAGLSSSASLEVAVGQLFKTLCGLDTLSPTELALTAQRAENQFVGCQCGIMDQLIAARGEEGQALLIDCRSLEARPVPMPQGVAVMIVHSRIQRGLVESEYNQRRHQCETAARHFGVNALRDVTLDRMQVHAKGLDPVTMRRALHVVTENQRTLDAAEALATHDLLRMGQLMAQSHVSMRDDFEITVPAIDALVELLQSAIGSQGGARMTGGGFGGCVVALLPATEVSRVRALVQTHYRSPEGHLAHVYACHPSAGAGRVDEIRAI